MVDSELQAKLDGYTQDVSARVTSRLAWKQHLRSWPVYTAAGSASLAMVASAGAGIIYSGIQNLTVTATSSTALVNIPIGTGSGISAFALANSFGTSSVGLYGGPNSVVGNPLLNFASGAAISGVGNPKGAAFVSSAFGTNGGAFSPSNTGFAGVKLFDPMGTHFGWIRLHVNSASSMTVIDWAYNDVAGAPINAGAGISSAVPEPSTMTMALLGAGSAGVLAWRRRRNEAAATPAA